VGWAGHVGSKRMKINWGNILVENVKARYHIGGVDVDVKIVLKCTLENNVRTGLENVAMNLRI
jgi:hypothetical protein